RSLIVALLDDLFGPDTWKPTIDPSPWIGMPNWVEHLWQFYDIQTDFLEAISEADDEADHPELAYFSGGSGDSCMFFHDNTTFYFLLTNGRP
ncbi:MAG: hypothetical protein JOZ51_09150, partial [Chloroflexi bacterium]|nr:hypothetical protein [Chloroflexota bacterium]